MSQKTQRTAIPEKVKLELWTKAGGRCQFRGCNKPLWYEGMTFTKINLSEMAHIIGASMDGPRGRADSEKLQQEVDNLMLLCREHHKLIDGVIKKYTENTLKEMKEEHETRVETLLEIHGEASKTTLVTCMINIGDYMPQIDYPDIANAISGRYPNDKKGVAYTEKNFNQYSSQEVWEAEARKITKKINVGLEEGLKQPAANHLSIFGLGPMPLLMHFGKCVGDINGQVHHSFRTKVSPFKWQWDEEPVNYTPVKFDFSCKKQGTNTSNVILLLAISDWIGEDKYQNLIQEFPNSPVYKIWVDNPTSQDLIRNKIDVNAFSKTYREALDTIQNDCGLTAHIYIVPAIPACLAVQCGRSLLPTKDCSITVCQLFPESQGFIPVLNLHKK